MSFNTAKIMLNPSMRKYSIGLKPIAIYLVILFVLFSGQTLIDENSGILSRIPLIFGIVMMVSAFIFWNRKHNYRLALILFVLLSDLMLFAIVIGPCDVFEGFKDYIEQYSMGIAFALVCSTWNDISFILNLLVKVALINAIYGVLFFIPAFSSLANLFMKIGFSSGITDSENRLCGLQKDPNFMGLLAAPACLIALYNIKNNRSPLNIIVGIILLVALFFTYSRTAWLSFLFGLFVYFMIYDGQFKTRRIALTLVLLFLFLYYFNSSAALISLKNFNERFDLTVTNSRSWIWNFWYQQFLAKPFGYGVGSIEEIRKLAVLKDTFNEVRPHNYYLNVLIEGGIQSLTVLLSIIALCFYRIWSTIQKCHEEKNRQTAILLFSLISLMSVGIFGLGGMFQLMTLFMGMCLSTDILIEKEKGYPQKYIANLPEKNPPQ